MTTPKWTPLAGAYVQNTKAPAWGPGKIALVDGERVHVFFRDYQGTDPGDAQRAKRFQMASHPLEPIAISKDPMLDNLPPFERKGDHVLLPHRRMTLAVAKAKFLTRFPGGFRGAEFVGSKDKGERQYKLDAHDLYVKTLGDGELGRLLDGGEVAVAARLAMNVLAKVNLLHPTFERARLGVALQDPVIAGKFLRGLQALLDAPSLTSATFETYLKGFRALPGTGDVDVQRWVVCTALPFLADPSRFMHLKPTETTVAADLLAFDLKYEATPNWVTYRQLMELTAILLAELSDMGCEDMIDVQSFIWVTCGGYDLQHKA